MYLYPESTTVVARYLLPELDDAACCLHCRQKLHAINPVAIHRLCGIVLCGDCFAQALVDYHSSPLVGRTPPCCPSCHHTLTEENPNLTLPPLRYAVQDSLSFLTGQRWKHELERHEEQQAQQANSVRGFGQVYEPVLFSAKNAMGEEFSVLPDGTSVRANPTPQPMHFAQLQQTLQEMIASLNINSERIAKIEQWTGEKDSFLANTGHTNPGKPYQNQNQNQNQNQDQNQNQNHNKSNKWNQNLNQNQNNSNNWNQYNNKNSNWNNNTNNNFNNNANNNNHQHHNRGQSGQNKGKGKWNQRHNNNNNGNPNQSSNNNNNN